MEEVLIHLHHLLLQVPSDSSRLQLAPHCVLLPSPLVLCLQLVEISINVTLHFDKVYFNLSSIIFK